ncbi:MAG: ATP-binding cassette domain-containing protein [Eubacterium sp.]
MIMQLSAKMFGSDMKKASPDIIKGLNFEIKKGEIFAIIGGNGTGKTTTMGIISGIRKAYRGKIKI